MPAPRKFQFTCPSRSTTCSPALNGQEMTVSIHVPLAEHDVSPRTAHRLCYVSIHVPLAEHDPKCAKPLRQPGSFNSRAPRGARPVVLTLILDLYSFNSRAPRGARPESFIPVEQAALFQFTCPSRSTTYKSRGACVKLIVSIHVPLAEHDISTGGKSTWADVSIHVPLAEHDLMQAASCSST